MTGFQTNNLQKINTLVQVDQTLENALRNSDAVFIELYQSMIWLAGRTGGALDPSATVPRTLLDWSTEFKNRRLDTVTYPHFGSLPNPYPTTYQTEPLQNSGSAALTYWYTDPAYCDSNLPDTIGQIVVNP